MIGGTGLKDMRQPGTEDCVKIRYISSMALHISCVQKGSYWGVPDCKTTYTAHHYKTPLDLCFRPFKAAFSRTPLANILRK